MRPIYIQNTAQFFRTLIFLCVSSFMLVTPALWSQDSESFFDDELPEEKKNSGDLKSKPVELKGEDEDEKKKALQKTNEKGEVVLPKEPAKPKDEGPTDQVAPLAARPKETILDNSRFSLAGDYFMNTGRGTATLPTGWGAFLAYDADESMSRGFDLRFEVGYLNITKNPSSITGFYLEGGLSWLYRVNKMPFQFITSLLPGIGYYTFKDSTGQGNALKLTAHAALGIEFPLLMKRMDRTDEIIPFIQVRGGVIYDNVLPVVAYGVYAGMAYKFGAVIFKY